MAARATATFCRRLFQDAAAAPRVVAPQTLEQVIRADQERFSALWNFDVSKGSAKETWQVIQRPMATFYTAPPRRSLKARRRLNMSIAERIRHQTKTPRQGLLTETPLLRNYTFNFAEPMALACEPTTSLLSTAITPCADKEPPKPMCPLLEHSAESGHHHCTPASHILEIEPVLKLPSPKPSKAVKRKSIQRMTDYFVVQKRVRATTKK